MFHYVIMHGRQKFRMPDVIWIKICQKFALCKFYPIISCHAHSTVRDFMVSYFIGKMRTNNLFKVIFWSIIYDDQFIFIALIILPLIIAVSGLTTFILIIGLSGVISGGVEGTLIVLMAMKAKKLGKRKPEYKIPINRIIATILIAIFVFGAGYYLWTLV